MPSTELTVYIGNRDLIFVTARREEISFRVTRMKCWRITVHHVSIYIIFTKDVPLNLFHDKNEIQEQAGGDPTKTLSFEYLQSKDNLEWITIFSDQAIVMALCLQEMVAQMVSNQQPLDPSRIGVKNHSV